jgi:hypothetical protein
MGHCCNSDGFLTPCFAINAPARNNWFHVKIQVADPEITVFVNGNRCLTVTTPGKQKTGEIGYWVGNGSAGDLKHLKSNKPVDVIKRMLSVA